ncbi:SDR family oxidoreductase [Dysgonomonas macrotermitis]|uniref:NADP-dependent 3-hydroxy acid dehydrogenase YdfG n=1 Tax=Dysgonomonas macrotermitis TaxID=1346286 RepID=A0A1M4T5Y9_9BACT|nr:SDR family oxidoreductase [Dysgonomonas macrotermitis]SHE39922.1 NADP-dependent 3-hydroxy acid dehydrogenase YdfG [Dysgonomonas macrotermitis]
MKTILITGTSNGIGKETALLFASKGWRVAATMRDTKHFSIFSENKNIKAYLLDVRDKDSIDGCIQQVIHDFGKIDVIVNNAGIYTTSPLEMTSDNAIDNIIRTNINGVIYTTKSILDHFRKNKSGTIVNISSIAGRATFPFQSVYHTSKWAVEGFSESLYYELEPLGIRVKIVEPGVVKTNLYESLSSITFDNYPEEYQNSFVKGYKSQLKNLKNGYSPILDAETIYKAVNSKSSGLRYTTDTTTKLALLLNWLLPLSIFRRIIKKINRL